MSIAFYDACIPSYLQYLRAVSGFLSKGLAFATAQGINPEEIVESRIHPDMLPFRFQIHSVVHHSVGALNGLATGVFSPPRDLPEHSYSELQQVVNDAIATIEALTPEAVNGYAGGTVVFSVGETQLGFTAEDFLFSFSLPNFYFHAATAYDLLRAKGVDLGKRDYLGAMRFKR